MRRRDFVGGLAGGVIALPFPSWAQLKVFRVGVFNAGGEPIPEV